MKKLLTLLSATALVWSVACGDGESATDTIVTPDVIADGNIGDVMTDNIVPDTVGDVDQDVVDQEVAADVDQEVEMDVVGDAVEEVQMEDRFYTFRTVGGISMGSAALTVAAHYPDMFDSVGALGGYVDYRYIGHLIQDFMGGGFCPMEDILQVVEADALNSTDEINNRDNPLVDCFLPEEERVLRPYEIYMTFNRMNYAEQGGTTFDRSFFIDVLGALVYAFGNFLFYNPEHPLAPPGVDPEWLLESDSYKCANPAHVTFPYNLNAEYNPTGEYDLITFCDGDPDVCRGLDDCDPDDPAMREKRGWYYPEQTDRHTKPVAAFLAVDYNGNGLRDYGEPVVFNMGERWDDFGVDGCTNEYEDGNGGCSETVVGTPDVDANGDDWDLMENNQGTEGNSEYDEGERFYDYGVDGVDAATLIGDRGLRIVDVTDLGENDGKYTYNPRWEAIIKTDARSFFKSAPLEKLNKVNYFFDGGIRDGLGALTSALHLANNLKDRGADVQYYNGFYNREGAVFPQFACDTVYGLPEDFGTADFSAASFGRSFLVAYGDPDLDPEVAYNNGSGGHIGSGCEVNLRASVPYTAANFRVPEPVVVGNLNFLGDIFFSSYYSEVLQSRRWYSVNLPPDYDSTSCYKNCDAENEEDKVLFNELEYPVSYMLPGIGMPLDAMGILTMLFNLTMGYGTSPRYILIVPDGQCCYRNTETGEQVCNCFRNSSVFTCVEKDCEGPHESCEVVDIPEGEFKANHVQECNSGHFFVNQQTNRFGAVGDDLQTMRFEDDFIEMIGDIEDTYRIRKPATVRVPVDF